MTSSRGDTWRKTADRPPADEQEKIGRVRLGAGNLRRRRRCLRRSGEDNDEGNMPAYPSECSALSYVTARQIDDSVNYCRSLINTRFENSENLYRKDLLSHYGCVNAIEFSNQGDLLVSGGDDRRVLLWKVEQAIQGLAKPTVMKAHHVSNIFCLGYNNSKTKIFSAGNDDQVIVHDLQTCDALNFFLHEKPVYGLSTHPHNDDVFASACDDGRVLIYDIRSISSMETFCLARYKSAFHSVMFNPMDPRMLATANAKEGVSIWDIRKPMEPLLRYGSLRPPQSCMNVRFNSTGDRLLALRRRLPPVLYTIDKPTYACEFDHSGYYNSCTMKSCCFAGENDEYVLSGSDDFNLYMWKIPPLDSKPWVESAHMVLRGHRSIVNQVRYNQASCILASSGVEKIIKIWSPFSLGTGSLGGLKKDAGKRERQRRVFTHDEYIGLVLRSGQFMTHDYSHQSTKEDPRMMAFFDSLVQREVEGWSSEDIPTAAHTASSSELNPIGEPFSGTDIDDTTSEGGVAPERSLESPNRITRLIANRREKLMRLAATECSTLNNSNAAERSASDSVSENNTTTYMRRRSKSKLKKRKYTKVSERRMLARRKCTVLKLDSDSDSDDERPVDATQPSTSSGLISRRSRYTGTVEEDDAHVNYSSSSSSSSNSNSSSNSSSSGSNKNNNNNNNNSSNSSSSSSNSSDNHTPNTSMKRKYSKTDSDTSTKPNRKNRRKCTSRHPESTDKTSGRRLDDDSDEDKTTDSKDCVKNGGTSKDCREDGSSTGRTSNNRSPQVSCISDNDIKSVISSQNSKNSGQMREDHNAEADNTSFEQHLKNFQKTVEEMTRRSYRKRSEPLPQMTVSTTSDSSD